MKFRIAHIFCGIGGKGLGAAAAVATHGDHEATFETIGGIDFDPLACRDFEMLVGAPALCADVHELEPADLLRFFGPVAPDVVMMSPPCKGFSGLLSAKRAAEAKYQKMNTLMERALFLVCATWPTPPRLIFVENVPRIASRGKDTVRRVIAMGEAHGYAIAQGTHDCGELGGLAQHRRRYFQLWRHRPQMAGFVYQPPKLPVRACGEVLGPMPMPGFVDLAGPMHSVPNLSWRNWVRLALIPAGGDWRDLPGTLDPGEKKREKFRRAPVTPWSDPAETVTGPGGSSSTNVADPRFGNVDRVTSWDQPVGTITRSPAPSSGAAAVADPRAKEWYANVYRVHSWDGPTGTVTGAPKPSSGSIVVADPRLAEQLQLGDNPARHKNKFAVHEWDGPVPTVTSTTNPGGGAPSVADPRWGGGRLGVTDWGSPVGTVAGESLPNNGKFSVADPRIDLRTGNKPAWQRVAGVTPWDHPAPTITAGAKIHSGAFQVADPRVQEWLARGDVLDELSFTSKMRPGHYGVLSWEEAAATIAGHFKHDNGRASVADPRFNADRPPSFTPVIIAADGTWHRPLTTLELAALQGFPTVIDGKPLVLAGTSHTRWREAIGNAVPPPAAMAIGEQLLRALLLASLGAFALDNNEIWVAPNREALVA